LYDGCHEMMIFDKTKVAIFLFFLCFSAFL
jgi:hypothetical protein